jgi:DNA (cytosine-5)-methyltransferase 1
LNNDERPTHVDLFSGIGGFALAAQWAGFRTVAFCEIDKYCQKILAKNFGAVPYTKGKRCGQGGEGRLDSVGEGQSEQSLQVAKNFLADAMCERRQQIAGSAHGDEEADERWSAQFDHEFAGNGQSRRARIYPNIFDLDGTLYRGVDLITGGFPCQPFSCAGKRRGAADDRAIWPQMFRVINEARPAWVLGENVPGIIPMELDNVLSDLERIGYATRAFVIPACAVDARHRRDRLWIVANASERRFGGTDGREIQFERRAETQWGSETISDANGSNGFGRERALQVGRVGCQGDPSQEDSGSGIKWLPEPDVGRVAHGIPSRVDRLRGLGNAIVPQVAYEILREIRKLI